MPRSLLFIETGARPARDVRRGFPEEGFAVDTASGIAHAQSMIAMRNYSGCMIFAATPRRLRDCLDDLMRCDGMQAKPVVCVADLGEADQVDMLERGASLCLAAAAPFAQILPQLRALFDVAEGFPIHYRICDLGIDPVARRASRAGRPLALRPREFDILVYLAEHAGRTVSRQELHGALWPRRTFSSGRIAVHIHNLRRAITAAGCTPLLYTVRGGGYTLSARSPLRDGAAHGRRQSEGAHNALCDFRTG